jgi:hypothetical protein
MRLEIPYWTSHHNMLVFSLLYFCEERKIKFNIAVNSKISINGACLYFNDKIIFFDYSDNTLFIDNPESYDFYFKRSLLEKKYNIYSLNFQVNFSYKSFKFLSKLSLKELINNQNRIEILRALDFFNIATNLSHNAMDVRSFPKDIFDNNGRVIFHSRLWDPLNTINEEEKERRYLQNEFRIEACKIIKNNFANSSTGLFPDFLSKKMAPDLLLDVKCTSKKEYFKNLRCSDIGIADDGLKDTPGWKIGEYLLFGKAVITTPLNITLENFKENFNYEKLSTRSAFNELPDKIECLLKDKKYLEVGHNNLDWSNEYLHPKNYIKRILSIIDEKFTQ